MAEYDLISKTALLRHLDMAMLTREYGIDFKKIKLHIESEKEFVKGTQKGAKNV